MTVTSGIFEFRRSHYSAPRLYHLAMLHPKVWQTLQLLNPLFVRNAMPTYDALEEALDDARRRGDAKAIANLCWQMGTRLFAVAQSARFNAQADKSQPELQLDEGDATERRSIALSHSTPWFSFRDRFSDRGVVAVDTFRRTTERRETCPRNKRKIRGVAQKIPRIFAPTTAKAKLASHLARLIRRHPIAANRLVWAALAGTLVWFADQPTVHGYNPLFEMFWSPGFCNMPNWDRAVLLLSWLITTLFCHLALFAFQKMRQQDPQL
jgi:hypothetical protein